MSSLRLLAFCRQAFSPSSSTLLPLFPKTPFTPNVRSFSRATIPCRFPSMQDMPVVANTTKVQESSEETWATKSRMSRNQMASFPMLNPYSGRTVAIKKDVASSLKVLDGILSRNKIKFQLRMTERHEKKGYKRRRLASERWRNQFANEVRKKVQLVMKMRDRGA